MYHAKERGRNDFQFYSQSLNEASLRRLELEGRLRFAAERGELELHFQPRVAGASGAITGFEALLRWRDPERGMVMPGDFIAVAEETGLIVPIGDWVLRRACETVRRWDDAGLPAVTLSVNVSAQQLRGEALAPSLRAYTQDFGIDPARLEVEITESTLVGGTHAVIAALEALRALGVQIAIDDFGTGYSCLGYLRTLPVDTLKVDRVFVAQIAERESERALTAAIVAMGQALGLRVVAEGVETTAQAYLLSSWGCDELQGYLISRPLPLAGIEAYWRKRIAVG
jgi:EAL domain-containing protein (putative c-di-GMP-specific phosphodiesterase class I)